MSERGLRENGTERHRANGGGESPCSRRSRTVGGSRIHRTARGLGVGVAAPQPWLAGARQWEPQGAEPRGGAGARKEAAVGCGTAGAADQRWTMADGRRDGKGAMVEQTVTREFVVGLAKGLHLRPADMLARIASASVVAIVQRGLSFPSSAATCAAVIGGLSIGIKSSSRGVRPLPQCGARTAAVSLAVCRHSPPSGFTYR